MTYDSEVRFAGFSEPVSSGRGVRVAVVDSGWDRGRVDARVLGGFGVMVDDAGALCMSGDVDDHNGHGTHCARIVLSIAPDAEILPVRVFGERLQTSVANVVAAMEASLSLGANVINLSLATTREDAIRPLYAACEAAMRAGALVVAAADRLTGRGYPAVFDNVLGVRSARLTGWRDIWHRPDQPIDFVTRGTPLPDVPPSATVSNNGNSYGAARIAGMMARFRELHPGGTLEDARAWLVDKPTFIPRILA